MRSYTLYRHITPNNKNYIGITSQNVNTRWKSGHGYKDNVLFWRAIKKYGWTNITHEILFENLTIDEAEAKEIEYIAHFKSNDRIFGYNISPGGKLSFMSEQGKVKWREKNVGRIKSLAERENIKNALTGKKFSHSHIKNLSLSHIGYVMPQIQKDKIRESNKIAMAHTRKIVNQYSKNMDLIAIYESIKFAAKTLGISRGNITSCCNGKRNIAGGFIWKYGGSKSD